MARVGSDQEFIKRLEEIIEESRFPSRAALAKAAGLPPSSLQSYLEGAEPTRPALVAMAIAADVSLEWLALGRGSKRPNPTVPDGYAGIPVYDIRKSGGYVYPLITEEISSWVYLELANFEYPGMPPAKLFVVEAIESINSEIRSGDRLVVDSSWRTRFDGLRPILPRGYYLVSREAKLSIREVTGVRDDFIELSAADGSGRKESFRIGEDGFTVHGRIIWFGRALPIVANVKTGNAPPSIRQKKSR